MQRLIIEIPLELAERLRPFADQLPQILELGLRRLNADSRGGWSGAADVFDFLARLPALEMVLAFEPSEAVRQRMSEIADRHRAGNLLPDDDRERQHYIFLEQLMSIAKTSAQHTHKR